MSWLLALLPGGGGLWMAGALAMAIGAAALAIYRAGRRSELAHSLKGERDALQRDMATVRRANAARRDAGAAARGGHLRDDDGYRRD